MAYLLAALLLSFQSATPPVTTPAPVLPEDGKPWYRTLSVPECVDWLPARKHTVEDSELRFGVYRMWVQGYVTGFNVVGPDRTGDLLGGGPQEELFKAIDGYCMRNPSSSVDDSMRPIAAAYIRRRLNSNPTDVPPSRKGQAQALATKTCRNWDAGLGNPILRLALTNIVSGYVTAYNRWGPDPAGDAVPDDPTLIEERVDAWCRQHPGGLLIGAVHPLIDHVASERAAGRLPLGGKRPQDELSSRGAIRK